MSLYGYVKKKVIWYKNNSSENQIDLSEYTNLISTQKDFKPSNNSCSIELFDNDLLYEEGQFLPKEDDKIFVWAKIVTNASDVDFTSADIIWNGKFVDHTRQESQDNRKVTLKVADWGYDVFNRYHGESYHNGSLTTDEIMVRIIRDTSEKDDRTFKIDTSNIATLRNDGSPFPHIAYGSISKPTYEWFNELSSTAWTNSPTEIANGTKVINYPMILDFRGNEAHWFEQPLTPKVNITDESQVFSLSFSTNNESAVSFLIIDCGEDLNSDSITTYVRDENSKGDIIKERFKSQLSIAGKNNDYDNQYHSLRAEAIASGWSNSEFTDKVRELAIGFAESWFRYAGGGQREIQISLPKLDIDLGEIANISRKKIKNGLYRTIGISQNIGTEWSTTLRLQELE